MAHTGYSGASVAVPRDAATLDLWRAALDVYRRVERSRPKVAHPQNAHAAATGAVMQRAPELDWWAASRIATDAVASCSTRHTEWMWQTREDAEPPEWW